MSGDRATIVTRTSRYDGKWQSKGLTIHDLNTKTSRRLGNFGDRVMYFAIDATARILAAGDVDGVIRVGRVDGKDPHLLVGHAGAVTGVAISPDLKWVASSGQDETLRLWPMPDLDKPPLHTLPHGELMTKLKTLTNLRVVRDEESSTGWKVEVGPFPGWATVPEW